MSEYADVIIETTVDLPEWVRSMEDAVFDVLRAYEERILNTARERWTGWKYESRPAGAPRNVSRDAWSTRLETQEGAVLVLLNEARGYRSGEAYVKFVARSKGAAPEYLELFDELRNTYSEPMAQDLATAAVDAFHLPRRSKKMRADARTDVFVEAGPIRI